MCPSYHRVTVQGVRWKSREIKASAASAPCHLPFLSSLAIVSCCRGVRHIVYSPPSVSALRGGESADHPPHRVSARLHEDLKVDPHNCQQRYITDLSECIGKLKVRLQRVVQKLAKQLSLNYELKRRITELEVAMVARDSPNSSLPPAFDPPARLSQSRRRGSYSAAMTAGQARAGVEPGAPHPSASS